MSTPAVASSDGGDGSVVKMLNGKTPSSVDMARVETTVQTSPPRKQVAVAAAAAVATSSEKDITKEVVMTTSCVAHVHVLLFQFCIWCVCVHTYHC